MFILLVQQVETMIVVTAVNMSGDIYHDNSSTYADSIGSISTGDILGFAVDLDNNKLYFY